MRVALFTETFIPKVDGIVTVLILLMDHLIRRNIDFVVVAPRISEDMTQYRGKSVIGVPGWRVPAYPELKLGPPTLTTYREVKRFKPDIAHFIHPAMVGTGGLMIAKYLNVPTLASFHLDMANFAQYIGLGFLEPFMWWYMKTNFNAADYALAPSRRVQRDMLHHGVRQVGLWRRGVDADQFNPARADADMRVRLSGGHPDDTILLYVGRLSNEKQIHKLRAAVDHVPGTRLAIVGDGPARPELEAQFAGSPTTFMGYLRDDELWSAYASADVFLFPSAMETFGLVLIEAMAAGLPVVTSRVGGADDMVRPGVNGYLFNVGDARGMIDGVRAIVGEPSKRQIMGRNARMYAETQAWPVMMDELLTCYEDLITGRPPSI
ncbi:glycosyltransferase family 4 protein [Aggregatilinea lenta]|uniref:glycosyltransferase family 4 protein n=1 Tax=Aggregatilinea lenta TaxID=913108 RepID=UPI000E5C376D|nr:glycosyltransferase family 1 protein [Aggregatilinea lenta]